MLSNQIHHISEDTLQLENDPYFCCPAPLTPGKYCFIKKNNNNNLLPDNLHSSAGEQFLPSSNAKGGGIVGIMYQYALNTK